MGGRIKRNGEEKPRLPIPAIGSLHIGEKALSASGKEYPRSLDHFKASGKYATLFHDAYGEKPDTIQIVFPSNDASLCCNEYFELRDAQGKLVADGDGEEFRVWSAKENIYKMLSTADYPNLMDMVKNRYVGSDWKVTLKLSFIIPRVRGVMGVWTLTTKGSASSIPQVRDAFDQMIEMQGKVAGIIFDLSVKMHSSNKPGDRSKYPVLTLCANESLPNLEMVKECSKPLMLEDR